MNFNDYYYIYKDLMDRWNGATNPKFIAKMNCVAIPKIEVEDINDLLKKINDFERSDKTKELMKYLEIA